ncbi:MAG: hypothetical protein ACW98D_20440 [Promethearchaeota archaeon]|jgi:hypothetical protein
MNNEPLNNDEIDKILDEVTLPGIEDDNIVSSQDLVPAEKKKLDVTDQDEIAENLVEMVMDDRKKADEIFDLFYGNLASDTDRTTASKEGLTKSVELKIEASKNIIELLKVKTRAEEQGTKVGVFFGGVSPKKVGLDVDDIRSAAAQRDDNKT